MMATLATTAAPKFSGVGEGAKEKKTMADIDKIIKSANNFYNAKVTEEGRGRFPGQVKYDEAVGGYSSDSLIVQALSGFTSYESSEGSNWVSVFGTTTTGGFSSKAVIISLFLKMTIKTETFDVSVGAEEFLYEFGGNPIKTPFQDGHYIYAVIGWWKRFIFLCPNFVCCDLENPSNFKKKLQP